MTDEEDPAPAAAEAVGRLAAEHRRLRRETGALARRVAQLEEANAALAAERDRATGRAGELAERHAAMAERLRRTADRVGDLDATVAALQRRGAGGALALSRLDDLAERAAITLPEATLEAYYARLAETAPAEAVAAHREELEATAYAPLVGRLFAEEVQYTIATDPRTLREYSTFLRGAADLQQAERTGRHLHEVVRSKVDVTDEVLATLIEDGDFADPPRTACEVGGAWGATIKHLTERFDLAEYHNYEIDPAYAAWAQAALGVQAKPVDGETLAATADASMDLAVANNALFFVPPVKAWSYLRELARVCRVGGLAVFNVVLGDRFDHDDLAELLARHFPRRAFSVVPEHFVRLCFPPEEFELVRSFTEAPGQKWTPYFVFRRIRPA